MSTTSLVNLSSGFVPTVPCQRQNEEERSENLDPNPLLASLLAGMSQPEDPPAPIVPQDQIPLPLLPPLFPNLTDLTELTKTIQSILPTLQLPLFPGLLPPPFPIIPGLPGFPFPNFLPPFKPPRKKRSPNKRSLAKKEFKLSPAVTGPPFKLDYAPHLRDSVFPIKRMHKEPTPDVVVLEGPYPKKAKFEPRKITKPNSHFVNPNFVPTSIPRLGTLKLSKTPLELLSQYLSPNPSQVNKIVPPSPTPNQKAYVTLKEAFPSWKYNYFKKRGIQAHTNCILEKKMCLLNKAKDWEKKLNEIERRFKIAKINIFVVLTDEDKVKLCSLFLKNCAELEKFVAEKEKTVEKKKLHRWMESQLKSASVKQYYLTSLPTYQQILHTIRDAINFSKIPDIDQHQKLQIVNCLQYDWTSPALHPQRIETFSNVIKLTPKRLTEILELAREKLKKLIFVRDYYWDIDKPLPPFSY